MECLQFRVKDVAWARCEIAIRDGGNDRRTVAPQFLKKSLQDNLVNVRRPRTTAETGDSQVVVNEWPL